MDVSIDMLSAMGDDKLLWTYAPWLLQRARAEAMALFMHSARRPGRNSPLFLAFDKVLRFLDELEPNEEGVDCRERYLEFMVLERRVEAGGFHDELALSYMRKIAEADSGGEYKAKLVRLLQESTQVQSSKLLAQAKWWSSTRSWADMPMCCARSCATSETTARPCATAPTRHPSRMSAATA